MSPSCHLHHCTHRADLLGHPYHCHPPVISITAHTHTQQICWATRITVTLLSPPSLHTHTHQICWATRIIVTLLSPPSLHTHIRSAGPPVSISPSCHLHHCTHRADLLGHPYHCHPPVTSITAHTHTEQICWATRITVILLSPPSLHTQSRSAGPPVSLSPSCHLHHCTHTHQICWATRIIVTLLSPPSLHTQSRSAGPPVSLSPSCHLHHCTHTHQICWATRITVTLLSPPSLHTHTQSRSAGPPVSLSPSCHLHHCTHTHIRSAGPPVSLSPSCHLHNCTHTPDLLGHPYHCHPPVTSITAHTEQICWATRITVTLLSPPSLHTHTQSRSAGPPVSLLPSCNLHHCTHTHRADLLGHPYHCHPPVTSITAHTHTRSAGPPVSISPSCHLHHCTHRADLLGHPYHCHPPVTSITAHTHQICWATRIIVTLLSPPSLHTHIRSAGPPVSLSPSCHLHHCTHTHTEQICWATRIIVTLL